MIDSKRRVPYWPVDSPPSELPAPVTASTLNQRNRFVAAYKVLEEAVEARVFPGAAFGVLYRGEVLALDGVGRFTYEAHAPAVLPTTVYDLASVTKVAATTAAAILLYDRGSLDLEQALGDILPGFVIGDRQRCNVTLRTLLAHSSGLPAYARLFEDFQTPTAMLSACLRMPLKAPPGRRAEYSDIGFILLGKALEVLTGESLEDFCMREVFLPLNMASTRYRPPGEWREVIAPTVDDRKFRGRVIQGEVHDENCSVLGGVSGHAGLFSSAYDMLQFSRAILCGKIEGPPASIFSPEAVNVFAARQPPQPESSRALGWDTPSGESSSGRSFSSHSIGHLGYTGTSLWIDLANDLAVVLLTNRTWPDRSTQAIRVVRPLFHNAIADAI